MAKVCNPASASLSWGVSIAAAIALLAPISEHSHGADDRIRPSVDHYDVTPEKHTLLDQYLKSEEAARYLARFPDMVLIDVRPRRFVGSEGSPAQAQGHVPFLIDQDTAEARTPAAAAPRMSINPAFAADVDALVRGTGRGKEATVMLICGSGMFSARAADLLAEAGYKNVYAIIDGMDGLKRQALP